MQNSVRNYNEYFLTRVNMLETCLKHNVRNTESREMGRQWPGRK